ncbi:hypothetical protein LSAT2_014864 [Lamellibrachia satsuma]|nr:hypothetical protein LSAT2_014864 [Lamellibrachia satsuma]
MMGARVLLFAGLCLVMIRNLTAIEAICPAVNVTEECVSLCTTRTQCDTTQRCCSNGCGNICMKPTGHTSLLVQLTTDQKWHYVYGTPAGLKLVKQLLPNLISAYGNLVSDDYFDSLHTVSGIPDFRLLEDNGHVALRSEISHTDAHSRPEVVQSRIAWLLAQKFAVAKTPLNLIGKLKAIVPIAGGQTTVEIESVCSIFAAKTTCRHSGTCFGREGWPACRCTQGYSGWFCETKLKSSITHHDGHGEGSTESPSAGSDSGDTDGDSRESSSRDSDSEDTDDSRESPSDSGDTDDSRESHLGGNSRTTLPPTTTTGSRTPPTSTTDSRTPPTSTTGKRHVVLVVRLAIDWKDSYGNNDNNQTQELVTSLKTALDGIYKGINGFLSVQVRHLFKSSVGVEHLVKAEMFVAGEKVEVNGACFLYHKKQLCKNGGTCLANQTAASCVCVSGYTGVYCDAPRTSRRKGKNTVGIVVGVIAAILIVGLIVCAVFLYRRRHRHHTKNEQMQLDGVENPTYALSPADQGNPTFTKPAAVGNPTYAG